MHLYRVIVIFYKKIYSTLYSRISEISKIFVSSNFLFCAKFVNLHKTWYNICITQFESAVLHTVI